MKKLQWARHTVQLLATILVMLGLLLDLPVFKIMIMASLVLGGVFYCGWVCSFGFLQDIFSKLGRKMGIKKRQVPESLHGVLIYFRYIFGVLVLVITADYMMILLGVEPRGTLFTILFGHMPSYIALGIMIFFVLISTKYDRVYCRYLCPEGARYGFLSMIRPFTIKRNTQTCVSCKKCDKACPMQIQVSQVTKLGSPQCVNCFECVSACPVKGCLHYGSRLKDVPPSKV